jgi:hypothetical protein
VTGARTTDDGSPLGEAALPALVVGIVAFGLARAVLLPGLGFWDTGEFQTVAPLFGTAHPTGYPTYVTLGWVASLVLTPFGEPAFRMNLLAAASLGVAAALVVVLVRGMAGRTSVAVGAGLLLALTPIAWRIGARADPHALHLALLAALLVVLVGWERRRRAGARDADRWLAGAAVLYGLMLGNHTLTVLLAPGIALYVLAVEPRVLRRPRFVFGCAALLVATTALVYLQLPIRAAMGARLVYGQPDTWEGFWYVVLAEQFRGDLVAPFSDLARKLADLVGLAVGQLGVLAAFVPAAWVLVTMRWPHFSLLTTAWLVVTAWFAASYTNAAIDRYYLGPLVVVVAWLGVAGGIVVDAVADRTAVRRAEAVVGLGAGVLVAALLLGPALAAGPTTAARVDASTDRRAADWSEWALAAMPQNAVVVSWWSFSTPLWYRTLVLGERPDVLVLDDRDRLDAGLGSVEDVIRSQLPDRPVFLVRTPAEIRRLESSWVLEPIADPQGIQPIYRVVGARPGAAPSPSPGGAAPSPVPRAARMVP